MAFYSIVTGNGFTGNAQRCSGSRWEGINLSTNSTGKKYAVSFLYRSNSDLAIYSGDYNEVFTEVNNSPILINTGSAKLWIGEYLSISNVENFLGLKSEGWFEIDQLRVNEIPNMLVNGTFDTNTWWATETGTSITESVARFRDTAYTWGMYKQNMVVSGKKYNASYQIKNFITGSFALRNGTSANVVASASGVYYDQITANNTSIVLVSLTASSSYDIDNVHLYEVPDYTYSGNHSYKYTLSDKYAITSSLYISASGAGRGSERITVQADREFSSDTGFWVQEAGWSILNGTANCNGTNGGNLKNQVSIVEANKKYEVTFTIKNYVSGLVRVQVTGGLGAYRSANGTYTEQMSVGAGTYFSFYSSNFSGSIDDVTVKEVLGEISLPYTNFNALVPGNKYTLEGFVKLNGENTPWGANLIPSASSNFTIDGTSWWYIGQGTKTWVSSSGVMRITQLTGSQFYLYNTIPSTTSGNVYNISFKYKSLHVNKSLLMDMTGTSLTVGATTNSWQDYIYYHKSTGTQFRIQGSSPVEGDMYDFDDISIREAVIQPKLFCSVGSKIVSSSILNPQGFTKFVLNFEATSNEVNQDIKLYLNNTGSVWVDNISITQRYDLYVESSAKISKTGTGTVINNLQGSEYIGWRILTANGQTFLQLKSGGLQYYANTDNKLNQTVKSAFLLSDDIVKTYSNGALTNTYNASIEKSNSSRQITLGSANTGLYELCQGLIGATSIIRFTNISSSNFNPTTYRMGWPISGGGVETVLWFDPSRDGSNISQSLQDWSGTGNALSGSNVDITNRILFT